MTGSRLLCVAVLLLGCGLPVPVASAKNVKVEFDKSADFSRIRQYQWRTHPVFEKNPELQEIYAVGIQLVLSAGNQELMNRGLQPVDSDPDVFITFFLAAQGVQKTVTSIETAPVPAAGYWWYHTPTWVVTEIEDYIEGNLVIDIVDARTSKLLWRAYCGDQIKDMRKRDKKIDSIVRKALKQFPPK